MLELACNRTAINQSPLPPEKFEVPARIMPLSKPHLPADFLQKLQSDPMMAGYQSYVFSKEFHAVRLRIISRNDNCSADTSVVTSANDDSKRTILHMAAAQQDPLLACEILRLGAIVDLEDREGRTPLRIAVEYSSKCKETLLSSQGRSPPAPRKLITNLETAHQRTNYIIRLLIEQHADVNRVFDGRTLLHVACQPPQWDIISLLLEHGATPSPKSQTLRDGKEPAALLSGAQKARFNTLAKSKRSQPRPPRVCPCWSGLSLSACHDNGKKQPYPPEYTCPCGSAKPNAKCCARKGHPIEERWDPEGQWIQHIEVRHMPLPENPQEREGLEKAFAVSAQLGANGGIPEGFKDRMLGMMRKMANTLVEHDVVDPAYGYALSCVDFQPRPVGGQMAKQTCLQWQQEWNAAVDQYIASGIDWRPAREIEICAKIGPSLGALYRECEGVDCGKTEGLSVEKLLKCQKCRIGVYCSRDCQVSAWKEHKKVCGKPFQREQSLPSQDAYEQVMMAKLPELANLNMDDFANLKLG